MRLESATLRGFRCFDASGQSLDLAKLTCLVGPNAAGKTALLVALARMFGETQRERTVTPSDFHLPPGEKLGDKSERTLTIEVRLRCDELDDCSDVPDCDGRVLPEVFNQMVVAVPGGTPYCRIRLEASWQDDGTPMGEVRQSLTWIRTPSDDPEVEADHCQAVKPFERARIRVVYVPATRDPAQQIRGTTATAFGRILKSLDWGGKDGDVRACLAQLNRELAELPGIKSMNSAVQNAWRGFYDGRVMQNVAFDAVNTEPAELLRDLVPSFTPGEQGQSLGVENLSDGLRSLFALSLHLGLFAVEQRMFKLGQNGGFKESAASAAPILTIFAIEEPENHLSPHYLGKIITELHTIAQNDAAQVLVSSHSPAIMRRIEPDAVRYLLGGETRPVTEVRALDLPPEGSSEAYKYVREAVRGFPELYFSRLVVLGEGPSEEIVLRRLFEESGTPLDESFISVVPLGGRHVHHFWRLLHGLSIPYVTLLDLDREKEGGGWRRLQYVRKELIDLHGEESEELRFEDDQGEIGSLAELDAEELERTYSDGDVELMSWWMGLMENRYNIFFSSPLDLDFSMLEAFPDAYRNQAPENGGPRLPEDEGRKAIALRHRMLQVLAANAEDEKNDVGSSYAKAQWECFAWYKYLFLQGSKPVAHMRALLTLSESEGWVAQMPSTLLRLSTRVRDLLAKGGDRGTLL